MFEWFHSIGLSSGMLNLILDATGQTLIMVVISSLMGAMIGVPVGVLLYISSPKQIMPSRLLHQSLATLVNIFRSIPFIILIVWIIPFTTTIMGTFIGLRAALVPLSIGVAPFIARMTENALMDIPYGLIEAARSMGANRTQIILRVLLPEALPNLIGGFTITLISLLGFSAMAGAVGAGGLGKLAYQYGYITNNKTIMNTILMILIAIVFIIQFTGNYLIRKLDHR